jgi:hypothetical protein
MLFRSRATLAHNRSLTITYHTRSRLLWRVLHLHRVATGDDGHQHHTTQSSLRSGKPAETPVRTSTRRSSSGERERSDTCLSAGTTRISAETASGSATCSGERRRGSRRSFTSAQPIGRDARHSDSSAVPLSSSSAPRLSAAALAAAERLSQPKHPDARHSDSSEAPSSSASAKSRAALAAAERLSKHTRTPPSKRRTERTTTTVSPSQRTRLSSRYDRDGASDFKVPQKSSGIPEPPPVSALRRKQRGAGRGTPYSAGLQSDVGDSRDSTTGQQRQQLSPTNASQQQHRREIERQQQGEELHDETNRDHKGRTDDDHRALHPTQGQQQQQQQQQRGKHERASTESSTLSGVPIRPGDSEESERNRSCRSDTLNDVHAQGVKQSVFASGGSSPTRRKKKKRHLPVPR